MSRVVQRGQPHRYDSGGMNMEYRYQQMSPCTKIAIPVSYSDADVDCWRKRLVENMDRTFEDIWNQLSDEEKTKINKECAEG